LPAPGQLSFQGAGKHNPLHSGSAITVEELPHPRKVLGQFRQRGFRENRLTVLASLSAPDRNALAREVDILGPQREALLKPQAAAVDQHRHKSVDPFQPSEHLPEFVRGEHDRQPPGNMRRHNGCQTRDLQREDISEKEEHSIERELLGGGGDLVLHSEM